MFLKVQLAIFIIENGRHLKKTGPKPKINKRLSSRIKRHITLSNSIGENVNCHSIINSLDLDIKRRTLNDHTYMYIYIYII